MKLVSKVLTIHYNFTLRLISIADTAVHSSVRDLAVLDYELSFSSVRCDNNPENHNSIGK